MYYISVSYDVSVLPPGKCPRLSRLETRVHAMGEWGRVCVGGRMRLAMDTGVRRWVQAMGE